MLRLEAKTNVVFNFIFFCMSCTITVLSSNAYCDVIDTKQCYIQKASLSIGESKSITINSTCPPKCVFKDLTIDGSVDIQIGANAPHDLQIFFQNVRGNGSISVMGQSADEIVIENLHLSRFDVKIDKLASFHHRANSLNLKSLDISLGSCENLQLGPDMSIDMLSINVYQHIRNVGINGNIDEWLTIQGSLNQNSQIGTLNLKLLSPSKSSGGIPSKIFMTNCEIGNIFVNGTISKSIYSNNSIGYNFVFDNISIGGQSFIIDASYIPTRSIELRGIYFQNNYASILEILDSFKYGSCDIQLVGITGLNLLSINWLSKIDKFGMKNVSSNSIVFKLGAPLITSVGGIDFGGVEIRDGIDASRNSLLYLAKNNTSQRPFDKPSFFRLIEKYGYHENEQGRVERPGLEALREAQFSEINNRTSSYIILAYFAYMLTGFGTTLTVPLLVWIAMCILFAVIYFIASNNSHLKCGDNNKNWRCRFVYSLFFSMWGALGFGALSDGMIARYWNIKDDSSRSQLFSSLARFQGIFTFIQLTLCSIYFGQTVLR